MGKTIDFWIKELEPMSTRGIRFSPSDRQAIVGVIVSLRASAAEKEARIAELETRDFWNALSSSAIRTYGHLQPKEALEAIIADHVAEKETRGEGVMKEEVRQEATVERYKYKADLYDKLFTRLLQVCPTDKDTDAFIQLATLETRLAEVRKVCAEAYQWAGAYGAPVEVLDNLSDAANGDVIRHKTILPIMEPDHITRLAESEKAREEAEEEADRQHLEAAELLHDKSAQLAALQEESVRLRDGVETAKKEVEGALDTVRKIHPASVLTDYYKGGEELISYFGGILSTTPETAKVQAVIEAAIVWSKSDTPIRDCSDRDLRHAIDVLDRDERHS